MFRVFSSPFLLNATLRHHLDKYMYESSYPNLIKQLRQSLYVDDLAFGAPDEKQAYVMFVTAKKILKDAGLNLRKFYSSSKALQERVSLLEHPQEMLPTEELEESYISSTLEGEQKLCSEEQKVLGMRWNISADRIFLGFEEIASAVRALTSTKQTIELSGAKIDWVSPACRPHGRMEYTECKFAVCSTAFCSPMLS